MSCDEGIQRWPPFRRSFGWLKRCFEKLLLSDSSLQSVHPSPCSSGTPPNISRCVLLPQTGPLIKTIRRNHPNSPLSCLSLGYPFVGIPYSSKRCQPPHRHRFPSRRTFPALGPQLSQAKLTRLTLAWARLRIGSR